MFTQAAINGFVAGVVTGVAALALLIFGLRRLRSSAGAFAGVWEQGIADSRGGERARDRVECRQRGSLVEGRIRREQPIVEAYKEWRFSGHVEGPLFSGVLWSADARRTPAAYTALHLTLIDAARIEGFMVNRQLAQNGARFIETTLQSPLVWTRPSGAPAQVAPSAPQPNAPQPAAPTSPAVP